MPQGGNSPLTVGYTDVGSNPRPATSEELQAQIQTMFEARSKEMEDKLKGQYDDRIKQLQQQLEDSRKSGKQPERIAQAEPPAPAPVKRTPQKSPEPAAAPPQTAVPQPTAPAQTTPERVLLGQGATEHVVRVLREELPVGCMVKASGGIGT